VHPEGGKPYAEIEDQQKRCKRFSKTAKGKIRRRRAYFSHLLTGKSRKRKRRLRKSTLVHGTNLWSVRKLIPYA
jgi:large subunit ribosomal protein L35